MKEVRCTKCNKLLLKANSGIVEVKCPRCKHINIINIESLELRRINDGGHYGKKSNEIKS